MEKIPLSDVIYRGDMAYRALKSYSRLESKWYKPEVVFVADQDGWPADWEGRTILALVMLAQSTKREPAYLERILSLLKERLNEKGYMGDVLENGIIDEQQLSGHNWLMRGLMEYYLWKRDEEILEIVNNIVKNLYLPVRGHYKNYPIDPKDRDFNGKAAGNLSGHCVNNWLTSTDIGCAYMSLDALSQYYQLAPSKEVKQLLVEMIETFVEIPFVNLSMQTHATLSATRGILRFYETTGEEKYLKYAEDIFGIYLKEGITENYANYNWFNRPQWTEPCAIVDSYMVAMGLFYNTHQAKYLEIAQRIYYNGMGFAQRHNGGFGCDICSGAEHEFLMPHKDLYEAYWCCTMRGADGVSAALGDIASIEENKLYLQNYTDCMFSAAGIAVEINTLYPIGTEVSVTVDREADSQIDRIYFYVPENADRQVAVDLNGKKLRLEVEKGFISCPIEEGHSKINCSFEYILSREDTKNIHTIEGFHTLWHGVLQLGVRTDTAITLSDKITYLGNGRYQDMENDHLLEPINQMIDFEEVKEARENKIQILFK